MTFFRNKVYSRVLAALVLLSPAVSMGQGSPNILWSRTQNSDRINALIFNPSGDTLISGSSDRLINFWRVSDGTLLRTLNSDAPYVHESAIESLTMTSDGTRLAHATHELVRLWTLPAGTYRDLLSHTDWVVGCAFSPNGQMLASASFDNTVKVWRVSDGVLIKTLNVGRQMRTVAFSPDGSLLAAGGGNNAVVIWRASDWTETPALTGHTNDIFTLAFSPNGTKIASGGYDQTVKVWSVASRTLLYTLGENGGNVYSVAFSPDGTQLAYTDGEGSTIRVHRVSDGVRLHLFTEEVDQVQCLAFSPGGHLGYGRVDKTVVCANPAGTTPPPPPPTNSWTLDLSVSGKGTVQFDPQPNGPGGTYLNGTAVNITAVPDGSNTFLNWSGAIVSTVRSVSLTMNNHKAVTAAFTSVDQKEIVWQHSKGNLAVWFFDGSNFISAVPLRNNQPVGLGWAARAVGDFDGDGHPDILFQHNNGTLAVWLMNGNNFRSSILLRNGQSAGTGWRVAGVGDFDSDGNVDILFQNTSSTLAIWFMNATQFVRAGLVNGGRTSGSGWRVVGVADFNADGQPDILWQNGTRVGAIWLMHGSQSASVRILRNGTPGPLGYRIIGTADFDDNNTPDLLWQHTDGRLLAWFMDGTDYLRATMLRNGESAAQGWRVLGSK